MSSTLHGFILFSSQIEDSESIRYTAQKAFVKNYLVHLRSVTLSIDCKQVGITTGNTNIDLSGFVTLLVSGKNTAIDSGYVQ